MKTINAIAEFAAFSLMVAGAVGFWFVTPAHAFDNWAGNRAWERQTEQNEQALRETQSQLNRMQERSDEEFRDWRNRNRMRNGY